MGNAPCSEQHPDKPEVHCNRAALKSHEKHSAYCWDEGKYVSWVNETFEPSSLQQEAQRKKDEYAQQASQRRVLQQLADKIRHG